MAFTPSSFQSGGSFVANLSGFQRNTQQLGDFFAGRAADKNTAQALTEVQARDEEGNPILEQRGTFKAADRAFNESSVKAYKAALQNDAMESITRIQAENPEDPQAFQSDLDGFKLGFLGEIEESVRPDLALLVDDLETRARINVDSAFRSRAAEENKVTLDRAQAGFKDQALSSIFEGDLDSFEIARGSYIESLDNPLLSASEVADRLLSFNDDADEAQFLGAIDARYDEDPQTALIALSAFENTKADKLSMSPQRQAELVTKGYQAISNKEKLAEAIETIGDEESKRSQLAFTADLTAKAYSNELSEKEFLDAVNKRLISPSQADSIRKRMNNSYAIKDNPDFVVEFTRDMPDLSTPEAEAIIDAGITDGLITASTANAMQKSINARDFKEESQEIKDNRKLLEGFAKEQGVFSKFDPRAEKRFVTKMADYNVRVADGEDPREVALDIIENGSGDNEIVLKTLPPLRFGSKDDLNQAEEDTLRALDRKEIDEKQANNELELIQTMQRLKAGIK